ncbi:MAG: porin, partial [Acidobacteria bacterium]
MNKYLTELIGTFFLVLTIGLSVLGGTPMAPLAI